MKRFVQLLAAVALSIGAALFGASSAHAQPIDCFTHVLDATEGQRLGKDIKVVSKAVESMKAMYPTADIYVQAYEYLPGGNIEGFWQVAQQCENWSAEASDYPRYNVFVVVYGHNVDQLGIFYGNGFEAGSTPSIRTHILTDASRGLGPETSQIDPAYIASALRDAVAMNSYYLENAPYFHDGIYSPPTEIGITGHEDNDPTQIAGIIFCVVLGFIVVGIVLSFVEPPIRRYLTGTSGPPTV